jgi:alcohol dehydrogenase
MKALIFQGLGKKALEERPKPTIAEPTDAIVKITKTTICGTDLHIIKGDVPMCQPGRVLGHEGVGLIEAVGFSATPSTGRKPSMCAFPSLTPVSTESRTMPTRKR